MDFLRIALAQINPTVGDLEGNVAKILFYIARAGDMQADIVAFPELALCGYPPEDLLLKPRFARDNREALEALVKCSEGITTVVGFPEAANSRLYNAAAVLDDGHLLTTYHKIELPNYGVFDEKRYFFPGAETCVLEIEGVGIGITICEDAWVDGGAAEMLALESGAQIILNISASPFHAGKFALRQQVLNRFASHTNAVVCHVNLVGGQDELVFDGGSLVMNPQGDLLAGSKRFEEDLLLLDLDTNESTTALLPCKSGRRKGQRVIINPKHANRREPISAAQPARPSRMKEIHDALVLGTRDYARKNDFQKAVLGLSGGIDSSLTAAIAVKALGSDNVIGVTMPSHYTSGETLADVDLLAKHLNIKLMTVPIRPIFICYQAALRSALGEGNDGVEMENLQARIRGNILMALSNRYGWLVLTTGNKSETSVGYSTLYGDTAGGFAVLKDVPKTMVYELADYVNRKADREVIPSSVVIRPPTAELKPNQKDEDSLPPYKVLDPILRAYVEDDKACGEIASKGFDAALVKEVFRMVDRSEYKRRQAPPGIKITPKAFGRDRRMPITNRYVGTLRDGVGSDEGT